MYNSPSLKHTRMNRKTIIQRKILKILVLQLSQGWFLS